MVKLDYQLSPGWNEKTGSIDLSRADESTLLYNAFLGDVIFTADGADFSARWDWVPILDFARNFFLVVNELANEPQLAYEFTESDAAINLKKVNSEVIVSSTYAAGTAKVPYEELVSQTQDFTRRVFRELGATYPQLKENPAFMAYQTEVG